MTQSRGERVFQKGNDERFEGPTLPPLGLARFSSEVQSASEIEGLTGPELQAKLLGYVNARQVLDGQGGLRNWRRAWGWMKAILQSLGKAFPPAAAILELADLIENGAKDIEDLVRDGALP